MCVQQKDLNTRKTTFRGSKVKYPKLDEYLYSSFDASHQLSIALPPLVIMEKVQQLSRVMNIF